MNRRRVIAGTAAAFLIALLTVLLPWLVADPEPSDAAAGAPEPPPAVVPARAAVARPVDGPEPPVGEVECELTHPIRAAWLSLQEVEPDDLDQVVATHTMKAEEGWFRFRPSHEAGLGRLSSPAYQSTVIAWAGGACIDLVELDLVPMSSATVTLDGIARDDHVSTTILTIRCGSSNLGYREPGSVRDPEGEVAIEWRRHEGEACQAYVLRHFGSWKAASDVVPVEGGEHLRLVVPALPAMGWAGRLLDDTYRVDAVDPGGRADRAGLEVRDRIVAVDDEPVADLDVGSVMDEEGHVRLLVDREGEWLTLDVGD